MIKNVYFVHGGRYILHSVPVSHVWSVSGTGYTGTEAELASMWGCCWEIGISPLAMLLSGLTRGFPPMSSWLVLSGSVHSCQGGVLTSPVASLSPDDREANSYKGFTYQQLGPGSKPVLEIFTELQKVIYFCRNTIFIFCPCKDPF